MPASGFAKSAPAACVAMTTICAMAHLRLRYKQPGQSTSELIETPITPALVVDNLDQASDNARWASAVAAFGQKLKGSNYGQMRFDAIEDLARSARGADENGYRAEFLQLVRMAQSRSTASKSASWSRR